MPLFTKFGWNMHIWLNIVNNDTNGNSGRFSTDGLEASVFAGLQN
jgi:hypothetical protein